MNVITDTSQGDQITHFDLKLKYAVPGDVMYYGLTAHIAIVLSNDESGTPAGVKLIESTHNGPIANVANPRTLAMLATKGWVVGRLR